ncbi:MAG: hypothetical protein IJD14_02235 [Christensenellaceae bacterium]|nr:hypothetical protein [Christensenellaceae bacterium]
MFYGIKKKIITANIKKRQAAGYSVEESELYSHPEGTSKRVNNSHFFTAHSLQGETIYIRLGIRGDGSKETWVGWYKNGRFIENEREFYDPDEVCPLNVECLEVAKKWHITYSGTMRDVKEEGRKTYPASFDLVFTANADIFDFFYDNDPTTTAHAIASKKWKKSLFTEIQKNNQRHYEQGGHLDGEFTVDGVTETVCLGAARDHSFGPRYWSYMDRHFWILAVDEAGNCLNISMVDYPSVDGIWTGYTTMFGGVESMAAIKCATDLNKAGHGDGKVHLDITLTNGKEFAIDLERDAEAIYRFDDGSYYFSEGLGRLTIDGKPARGTIEFSYNGDESRWINK